MNNEIVNHNDLHVVENPGRMSTGGMVHKVGEDPYQPSIAAESGSGVGVVKISRWLKLS